MTVLKHHPLPDRWGHHLAAPLAITGIAALLLGLMPWVLGETATTQLMQEHGPIENTSTLLWLLAIALVVTLHSLGRVHSWAFAVLFAGFAAREHDWHKTFTGESMLKDNYYQFSNDPLWAKVLAGAIALVLIVALLFVLVRVFRFIILEGGWRRASGLWLSAGFALLFITKTLDRSPGILKEDFGVELPFSNVLFLSLEEGLEIVMPAFICIAIVLFWREIRHAHHPAPLFRAG